MIEKIRRTLIIKYTFVIAAILSVGFAASYAAYRHNSIKLLYDGLYDYLTEEIWEAGEFLNTYNGKREIHKVKSDIKSLHNFTYWIVDNNIIHAERPENDAIAEQLEHRLLTKDYEIGSFFAARSMTYIERSYEKQKKFVSDAAHELRTPLAILYSYTELLEYDLPKKDIIENIKEEILQMNNLVDKLLSIARYDNSTVILQKELFSLNDIISDSIKSMQHLCPAAKFDFDTSNLDIKLQADKILIKQLITIFLDNAIKYSDTDKKIEIKLEKRSVLKQSSDVF